ncbi:MAG: hypothetical protein JWR69_4097 [Pedosphaera sp.]|nr:hypothetical protein [Pedosphaera sp.]
MNADEKAIVDYLKSWPKAFVSGREIARKVGGKHRYEQDRSWAVPILMEMVNNGLVDTDSMGCFRLKRQDEKKKHGFQRHVSPQILRILRNSGKSFEGVTIEIDVDEPDEPAQPEAESPNLPAGNGASAR